MKIRKLSSAKDVKKFIDSSKTGYVKVALTDIDGINKEISKVKNIRRGEHMFSDDIIPDQEDHDNDIVDTMTDQDRLARDN